MALSADQKITRQEGVILGLPVAGSTKIYGGSLVAVNADGYAVPASDTAGLKFKGIARAQVDNSSGGNGDLNVEVWTGQVFELTVYSTLAQTDLGRPVFVKDDGQVDLKGAAWIKVGRIAEVVSTSKAMVRLDLEVDEEFTYYLNLPVASGAVVEQGSLLAYDQSGYVQGADDASTLACTGAIAAVAADNSGGSAGEIDVVAEYRPLIRMPSADALSDGNLGDMAYMNTSTTFSLSGSELMPIGRIVQVIDAGNAVIAVDLKEIKVEEGFEYYFTLPVGASTIINQGDLVAVNASGMAYEANDLSTLTAVGAIAVETADNSIGAASAVTVFCERKLHARMKSSDALSAGNLGDSAYMESGIGFGLTTTESRPAGTIAQVIDTEWAIVALKAA